MDLCQDISFFLFCFYSRKPNPFRLTLKLDLEPSYFITLISVARIGAGMLQLTACSICMDVAVLKMK